MKTFTSVLLAMLIAIPAQAASKPPADTTTGTARVPATTPAKPAKMKCIRDKETGSNRTKRVCLPEDQFDKLTAEERVDLLRSDKPPAELLGD